MSTSPYCEAGRLLDQIITQRKSLKTLAFSKNKSKKSCSKVAYAQVCHTLQYKSIIESILNHNQGRLRKDIQADKVRNKGLLYILLYELLFGLNQNIRGGGQLKRDILKNQKVLRETRDEVIKKVGASNAIEKAYIFPRYIRVNTLKTTTQEVVATLRKNLQESRTLKSGEDKSEQDDEDTDCIFSDPQVPDLLIISPQVSIQWHKHELVTSGKIILQDKSSCFSALALVHGNQTDNPPEGDYIDACAAPGNKTSHLAALIHKYHLELSVNSNKKKGSKTTPIKIFAFDRASNRISILCDQISRLIPSSSSDVDKNDKRSSYLPEVLATHEDFLKVDPKAKTYKKVRCILLDPSCSGSGIIDTPDRLLYSNEKSKSNVDEHEKKRIEKLSNFQLLMLKHAMSFPQVQRIVYSTCSVHELENEHVVFAALNEANGQIEEDSMQWILVSPFALQGWKRRGHVVSGLTESQANCLVRVDGRDGDDTNGFFVSYFERKGYTKKVSKETTCNPLVSLPSDVKAFYAGEFRLQNKISVSEEVSSNKEIVKEVAPIVVANQSTTDRENAGKKKLESKIAKKKAKKIMWKRRQKQEKMLRLKKRATDAGSKVI